MQQPLSLWRRLHSRFWMCSPQVLLPSNLAILLTLALGFGRSQIAGARRGGACGPQKLRQVINTDTNRSNRPSVDVPHKLKVVIDQEPTEIIRLQPVIEVNLVKIRGHDFLPKIMGLTAQERNLQAGQNGNQRLRNTVRIAA